jgi:Ca-activated chloride channel family protein
MLQRQGFNDDKVDAGDMGAGHSVTAIYEITPASASSQLVDPLRYNNEKGASRKLSSSCRTPLTSVTRNWV